MTTTKTVWCYFPKEDESYLASVTDAPYPLKGYTMQRHTLKGTDEQFAALFAQGTDEQVYSDGYEAFGKAFDMVVVK